MPASPTTCRELVERIVASGHFTKSQRQRQLLVYLVDRALNASARHVHEQEIGAAVFGRSPDYDTSADNIVRVNVHDLRKRLEAYFSAEGRNEAIVIDVPKGGYCPQFLSRGQAPQPGTPPAPPFSPERVRWTRYVFPAIALALFAVCIWLAVQNAALSGRPLANAPTPRLGQLWSRMFAGGRALDVVVADSNLSFLQDAVKKPLSAGDYFQGGYLSGRWGANLSAEQRSLFEVLMSRRYTSMADVYTLQRLSNLRGRSAQVSIYFSRDFAPEDLKTSNVVLLGSRRSNPWVEYFENELTFRIDPDKASGYGVVVNRHPHQGEPARYPTTVQPPMTESFGVVAFVPNLARTGNVLILEGAGMHATEAAGELVTEEEPWMRVLQALHLGPGASLPYFEVLFRTRVLNAAMQPPEIVAVRPRTSQ